MLIKDVILQAEAILKQQSPTYKLDVRLLICKALQVTHEELILQHSKEISGDKYKVFCSLVDRRIKYEPIAYILGRQEFYSREFLVNSDVLVPRPETELIIDLVLKEKRHGSKIKILDLGTGSGAIAITIACEINDVEILATDISSEALEVAKKNASMHKVQSKIKFAVSNWFENIDENSKFDYIISNPPYICKSQQGEMSQETVLFEPQSALFAKNNGLYNYEIIVKNATHYLVKGGKLMFEIGYSQGNMLVDLMQKNDFQNIIVTKDLSGRDRVIKASAF